MTSACGIDWPSAFPSAHGLWQALSKLHRLFLHRALWQAAPRPPPLSQTWIDTLNEITVEQVVSRPSLSVRWHLYPLSVRQQRAAGRLFGWRWSVWCVCGGERCCCQNCAVSDGLWCWMRAAFVPLSAISVSVVRVWDGGFANGLFRAPSQQTRLSIQSPHSQGRSPGDLWNSCCQSCLPSQFIVVCPIIVFFLFLSQCLLLVLKLSAGWWTIQSADNMLSNSLRHWAQWSEEEH